VQQKILILVCYVEYVIEIVSKVMINSSNGKQ